MWNFGMYEWMANERIATYRREAAQDRRRRLLEAIEARRSGKPAAATDPLGAREAGPFTRRAVAAAFVGLAGVAALRRRR
jgi:hypothetical protein